MKTKMLFWLVLICWASLSEAIWIEMPSSGTKCVSENIQNNVLVVGFYSVINTRENSTFAPTISARVTSPYGNNLHHVENVTSDQFAFKTTEAGNYLACFWLDPNHEVEANHQGASSLFVALEWRIGFIAKDWDSVAKKEKIDGVELDLRKLEGAVEAIHENLIHLKSKEADMREVSEKTNAKVALYSITSLGLCVVVSVLQLWYLKTFFRQKKLI